MSRTKKLTLSALVAALCAIALYGAVLLPQVSLTLTALAGIFPAAVVIACGSGWALGTFTVAAILSLVFPDRTPGLWFVFFFGHYPIWKAWIERLQTKTGKPVIGWALKLLGAALCLTLLFLLFRRFFFNAVPTKLLGSLWPLILVILAAAFIVYDVAFSTLIGWFRIKILPKMR